MRELVLFLAKSLVDQPDAVQVMETLMNKTLQTGTPLILVFAENETADEQHVLHAIIPQIVRLSGVCPILALIRRETGAVAESILPYADFRIFSSGIHENTVSDIQAMDAPAAIEKLRALLHYLPLNCAENAPVSESAVQTMKKKPDPKLDRLQQVADAGSITEIYRDSHVRIAFARICGKSTAVLYAQNGTLPQHAARFMQFCDCYSLPMLVLSEELLQLSPLQTFVLAQATAVKILVAETPNALFDLAISGDTETLRDKIAGALEYLAVKRDVLPPHKHGNLPL